MVHGKIKSKNDQLAYLHHVYTMCFSSWNIITLTKITLIITYK